MHFFKSLTKELSFRIVQIPILIAKQLISRKERIMPSWQYYIGWILVALNSLCLLRLGLLPMIFFGRNYKLYSKIFWVSCLVTIIFLACEVMLIRMLLHASII